MKKLRIAVFLFISMCNPQFACAEPVAVIVNSANTQNVSQVDVKNIYQDRTVTWASGDRIAVYNLPPEDAAAGTFATKVLGASARDAASSEANRITTNTSRNPQLTRRDALVASLVAKTPNSIGYVPRALADGKSGLRVLFTLE